MSPFAIRNPYFIVVCCLIMAVLGIAAVARMPVDMFPAIRIPVVVVGNRSQLKAGQKVDAKGRG